MGELGRARICAIDDVASGYYVNLSVIDRPGVLSAVAGVFGDHQVSIRSMEQEALEDDASGSDAATIHFITHEAIERDLRATLEDLRALDAVGEVVTVMRVVESE